MIAALALMIAALAVMVAPRALRVASMARMDASVAGIDASMLRKEPAMALLGRTCGAPVALQGALGRASGPLWASHRRRLAELVRTKSPT